MNERIEFAKLLVRFRREKGLTLRSLANAADMQHTYIALLEARGRAVGPGVAERLAQAFHLEGEELAQFLSAAAKTIIGGSPGSVEAPVTPWYGHLLLSHLRRYGLDGGSLIDYRAVPYPNSRRRAAVLWTACDCQATAAPIDQEILELLRKEKGTEYLFLVFLPAHVQALVSCDVIFFQDGREIEYAALKT